MPGILPMKVIKVGSSAQSRIAQACDRCRSKKIRCDGIRPSCTQCLNVGFECKTSDKLSRRAFPRGYTESLEERVRALEAEVRELKDLLDEKDEKIDMLSRLHSHSPQSNAGPRRTSPSPSPCEPRAESQEKDEVFKIHQSPQLLDDENKDSYFVGSSSGRTLVEAFKQHFSFLHPGLLVLAFSHVDYCTLNKRSPVRGACVHILYMYSVLMSLLRSPFTTVGPFDSEIAVLAPHYDFSASS